MASNDRREEMRAQAKAFHKQHPEVWRLFCRFTREKIDAGFKHYSVNAIFERIRWETDVPDADGRSTFKLNNNFRAFYARAFMRSYPEFSGFFRTREQTSKDAPATGLPPLGPADYTTYPNDESARRIAP